MTTNFTGKIVSAAFEDGNSNPVCEMDPCHCPAHDEPPLPAGTYITIRLDDEHQRIAAWNVTITPKEN